SRLNLGVRPTKSMSLALQIIFLLSLPVTFGAGIMYLSVLHDLGRSLETHHPETLELVRADKVMPMSRFQAAYQVLRGVKGSTFRGTQLSPDTVRIWSSAKRLLYVAAFSFLALLFSGLAA